MPTPRKNSKPSQWRIRVTKTQINIWLDEIERRRSDVYPIEREIAGKVSEYRKSKKRSQEMLFLEEQWYIDLIEKRGILKQDVIDANDRIKTLIGQNE